MLGTSYNELKNESVRGSFLLILVSTEERGLSFFWLVYFWYYCSSLWPFCFLRKLKTHLTYTQMIYDVHFDDQINWCWTALLVAQQGTPAFAGADRFHLRVVKILRGFKNKVTTVLQYLFCFLRTKTCRSHTHRGWPVARFHDTKEKEKRRKSKEMSITRTLTRER